MFMFHFLKFSIGIENKKNIVDILKIIYLGFKKSQRSVAYDFRRYINILTYLLTYLNSVQSADSLRLNFFCTRIVVDKVPLDGLLLLLLALLMKS